MHGGGGGIYCSALLEIQMYYYEAGGCMGDVPASRSNPLAPHPQASGCMGAIIVAVNSAAPLRPCLNRPLRMVHYGPCWLQLSRGADLCTVAWRWRGGAMLVYWGSPFLTHWRRRAQVLLLEVKGAVMRSPLLLGAHPSVWAPPPPPSSENTTCVKKAANLLYRRRGGGFPSQSQSPLWSDSDPLSHRSTKSNLHALTGRRDARQSRSWKTKAGGSRGGSHRGSHGGFHGDGMNPPVRLPSRHMWTCFISCCIKAFFFQSIIELMSKLSQIGHKGSCCFITLFARKHRNFRKLFWASVVFG